jgi:hypothetical protein
MFMMGYVSLTSIKIDLGFSCKIKMKVKTAKRSLNTNVIPMPWDQLDCISSYMMLDVRVFNISLLGNFCQYS